MMRLPKDLQTQLRQVLNTLEEESKMVYITSIEQLAKEEGMQAGMEKGMQQGVQRGRLEGKLQLLTSLLEMRFGELPLWVGERLALADETTIKRWTGALLSADSLDTLFDRNWQ
ncbi:MAG: hypothetical protein EBV64_14615 [Oxalobacteraceae bacterium]|nr:hypothetical protein [Oxalobacteraceae bacterium]